MAKAVYTIGPVLTSRIPKQSKGHQLDAFCYLIRLKVIGISLMHSGIYLAGTYVFVYKAGLDVQSLSQKSVNSY